MIFVDTGYLIALINPDDDLHARALAWAAVVRERLLLTEYVLVETVNHFSSPLSRQRVHTSLKTIQASPHWEIIPASTALLNRGLQLHNSRADKEWSLTDCISFIAMHEHRLLRALAHDHHFEQAGFRSLLRRDP